MVMKLVAPVQLVVNVAEKQRLLATLRRVNEACEWLGGRAFDLHSADKIHLQHLYYAELRQRFGLPAQYAVRTISKVCEVYRRDKAKRPHFKLLGAIPVDQRLYSFKKGLDRLSILAIDGRMLVPVMVGDYHRGRLEGVRGQADLVYRAGKFYLFVTVEVPDGTPIKINGTLGVDLGIRNLATDSDGESYSGDAVEAIRARYSTLRAGLQSCGTRSAKRHLKRSSGQEAHFRADVNHRISKQVVAKARGTGRQIALEDLTHIRDRVTVRGPQQRSRLHGWSFFQLRSYINYKAALSGVPVVLIDPRNTSRECPECHHIDKRNRRTQAEFRCISCGFAAHADWVGARNIAERAIVNWRIVAGIGCGTVQSDTLLSLAASCPL